MGEVVLDAGDVRRLRELLEAIVVLLRTVQSDDRVIDLAAVSLQHAAEDWVRLLADASRTP